MLNGLLLLEHLVLEDAVAEGPDELVLAPVARGVKTVHLAYVELRAWNYRIPCTGLLNHLVLPACRTFLLEGYRSDVVAAEAYYYVYFAVASALGGRFAPRSCELRLHEESVAVGLWQDAMPAFKFKRDGRYGSNEDGELLEYPQAAVEIRCFTTSWNSVILPIVVSAFPLSDVRTPRFWHRYCDHSMRSLSFLQKVETFLYHCKHPVGLLQALSESQHGTLLLFPTLRCLAVRHAEWHGRNAKPDSDAWRPAERASASALCCAHEKR